MCIVKYVKQEVTCSRINKSYLSQLNELTVYSENGK